MRTAVLIQDPPHAVPCRWHRAMTGIALGALAPVGWLIVQAALGTPLRTQLEGSAGLYLYMLIATSTAFGVFGAWLGAHEDKLEAQNRRLGDLALTDPMTGLRNLRYFQARFSEAYDHAVRGRHHLAVAVIDVDRFKSVNDTHGHPVGDMVLKRASAALERVVRRDETLARVGGEEFAILLPGADARTAERVAERVRKVIESQKIRVPGQSEPLEITASVGVASTSATGYRGRSELYNAADEALLRAKQAGRNRVEVTGPLPLVRICA